MRFIGNMGISPRTIEYLLTLGHHAYRLLDVHLERLPDIEILERARREDAVIRTNDLDFGDLLAATRAPLPSVVIFRLDNMRPNNVNQHLLRVLKENEQSLNEGAIVIVTEQRIRVRRLPI